MKRPEAKRETRMPNHCHNDLYICGTQEAVQALLTAIASEDRLIDFNKIIPYPENFRKLDEECEVLGYAGFAEKYGPRAKDGYNSGGYEWCTENWGTKWNAYHQVRRDYEGPCITFQTAWTPPVKVIQALAAKHPEVTLRLEWFECGVGSAGGCTFFSKSDHEDYEAEGEWEPGIVSHEWEAEYHGHRGG